MPNITIIWLNGLMDKLFIEPLGGGEDYGKLKPTIVICLLAFDLFREEERCVWGFRWMSPEGKILTDVQQLFYVKMDKAYFSHELTFRIGALPKDTFIARYPRLMFAEHV